MRIAVIDDDIRMTSLCEELQCRGHDVRHLRDPDSLAHELAAFAPEALVLDLMMPGVTIPGPEYDCLEGLALYESTVSRVLPGVPFAVLSATDMSMSMESTPARRFARYSSFRGFVRKPCDGATLLTVLGVEAAREVDGT